MYNKLFLLLTMLVCGIAAGAQTETAWTTICNGEQWTDHNGNVVHAHGAGFLKVGDTWYMIGEDRGSPQFPDVNMYSSKDLQHWRFERKIIKNGVTHPSLGSERFIERPKLMYCAKTGKYVVWCHWEARNYGASEAAVFYCDSVNGDYTFHWAGRPLGVKSRDCNVFVDNDGTAYFISTIEENQHLGLFKLSDDYLSAESYTELFKGQSREAPAIIRIGDTYFMMFSACTGWAPNQASYSFSKSLTEGWSERRSIGNDIAFDTQAASILTIRGTDTTSYLYVGDRWQDPDLPRSKTIIFPIAFSGNDIIFDYTPMFDINYSTGQTRSIDRSRYADKRKWKVAEMSSEETTAMDGRAANAIDGDNATIWHTDYNAPAPPSPKNASPFNAPFGMSPSDLSPSKDNAHYITIDMGVEEEIKGFLCVPRHDNSSKGLIRAYAFEVSLDNKTWQTVSQGWWLPYHAEVAFNPVKARYFKISSMRGESAAIAEIDVIKQ